MHYPNDYICRGVARSRPIRVRHAHLSEHRRPAADRAGCERPANPCAGFGNNGTVIIPPGEQKDGKVFGRIHTTSAPVVSHGVVIVGSSIDDNQKVDELRGTVHAFDAMTGAANAGASIRWPIRKRRSVAAPRMSGRR